MSKRVELDGAEEYIKADECYVKFDPQPYVSIDSFLTLCVLCGCLVDKTFVFIHREHCNLKTRAFD